MFEWKPPDPRLVALVRQLEAAVMRRIGSRRGGDAMTSASEAADEPQEAPNEDPHAQTQADGRQPRVKS